LTCYVHSDTCITDTQIMGTLCKGQYTFFIIPCSVILLTRNVADKSCSEYQNTHFVSIENCAIYEIMCKDIVDFGRLLMMIWHLHIACWITKPTDTYSEYVILIAFPLQQWLHVCTLMLCYCYWLQTSTSLQLLRMKHYTTIENIW